MGGVPVTILSRKDLQILVFLVAPPERCFAEDEIFGSHRLVGSLDERGINDLLADESKGFCFEDFQCAFAQLNRLRRINLPTVNEKDSFIVTVKYIT